MPTSAANAASEFLWNGLLETVRPSYHVPRIAPNAIRLHSRRAVSRPRCDALAPSSPASSDAARVRTAASSARQREINSASSGYSAWIAETTSSDSNGAVRLSDLPAESPRRVKSKSSRMVSARKREASYFDPLRDRRDQLVRWGEILLRQAMDPACPIGRTMRSRTHFSKTPKFWSRASKV